MGKYFGRVPRWRKWTLDKMLENNLIREFSEETGLEKYFVENYLFCRNEYLESATHGMERFLF